MDIKINRCSWPGETLLMIEYHDKEWGVPLHDDLKHFEFLVLDAFQAGLSWLIVLNKREAFRIAFDGFDYSIIANYTQAKIDLLNNDASIIRNKAKIKATVSNAIAFMEIQKEFGSFDRFIWRFTNFKTKINYCENMTQIPVSSPESIEMSKELKRRGFKFVGPTICYAYMQAAGMVNDHLTSCFRYNDCC